MVARHELRPIDETRRSRRRAVAAGGRRTDVGLRVRLRRAEDAGARLVHRGFERRVERRSTPNR